MFLIGKEELIELLGMAFEEGWAGYKDLKESSIKTIVDEFAKKKEAADAARLASAALQPAASSNWLTDSTIQPNWNQQGTPYIQSNDQYGNPYVQVGDPRVPSSYDLRFQYPADGNQRLYVDPNNISTVLYDPHHYFEESHELHVTGPSPFISSSSGVSGSSSSSSSSSSSNASLTSVPSMTFANPNVAGAIRQGELIVNNTNLIFRTDTQVIATNQSSR